MMRQSYDRAEICELAGIYILSRLSNIIDNNDCGLYRADGFWFCVMSMDNKSIVLEKMLFNYLKALIFS